ncbi:MAG: aspartyl protease family protein [Acidobacteriota bacterium]
MAFEVGFRLVGGSNPLILVPARVNGIGPFPFLLDTGSGLCLLSPGLAGRAKVAAAGRETATGAGGPVEVELGTADAIAVGEAEVRGVPVAITGELGHLGGAVGASIEGDVGYGFLKCFRLTIDYEKSRLTLVRPEETSGDAAADGRVPFRLATEEKPLVLVTVYLGEEGPFEFALDTGASMTIVSPEVARGLGGGDRWPARMLGGGGRVAGLSGAVARVRVGQDDGRQVGVVIGPFLGPLGEIVGTKLDGILGYNFLRQFRLTIDYPARHLVLEPRAEFARIERIEKCGTASPAVEAPR